MPLMLQYSVCKSATGIANSAFFLAPTVLFFHNNSVGTIFFNQFQPSFRPANETNGTGLASARLSVSADIDTKINKIYTSISLWIVK